MFEYSIRRKYQEPPDKAIYNICSLINICIHLEYRYWITPWGKFQLFRVKVRLLSLTLVHSMMLSEFKIFRIMTWRIILFLLNHSKLLFNRSSRLLHFLIAENFFFINSVFLSIVFILTWVWGEETLTTLDMPEIIKNDIRSPKGFN